jgi:Arc/MetJ family transcription regulator
MRTTVNLDDALLDQAMEMTDGMGKTALINAGLRVLTRDLSAQRLATLGGSEPGLEAPPRRGRSADARSWSTHRYGFSTSRATINDLRTC